MRPISTLIGLAFRSLFASILLVRRPRPIHAHGVMLAGRMRWLPRKAASGIRWIDDAPAEAVDVIARASRSIGLPAPLPDIVGLALRLDGDDGPADLELASTGFGVPSRFWLVPQRSPSRARLGTLLPYRGALGPVLICARTIAPRELPVALTDLAGALERSTWRLRLYWARPSGKWRAFAEVELGRPHGPIDGALRFDAVRHPLPGADTYDWVRAVRQPSYRLSQS